MPDSDPESENNSSGGSSAPLLDPPWSVWHLVNPTIKREIMRQSFIIGILKDKVVVWWETDFLPQLIELARQTIFLPFIP